MTLGIAAWVLAAGPLVFRVPFGTSTRDESFYSAMPGVMAVVVEASSRGGLLPVTIVGCALLLVLHWSTQNIFTVTRSSVFWTACPVLAPVCLALSRGYPHRRLVLEQLWAPSVLMAVIVSWTSATGPYGAHLGTLLALVAGIGLFALVSEVSATARDADTTPPRAPAAARVRWLFTTLAATLLGTQLHSMFDSVYDYDTRLSACTTQILHGPYRGARTSKENAQMLEAMASELKALEDPSKTIAAFDECSVAYLSTRMRPRVFTHWVVWFFNPSTARRRTPVAGAIGGLERAPTRSASEVRPI